MGQDWQSLEFLSLELKWLNCVPKLRVPGMSKGFLSELKLFHAFMVYFIFGCPRDFSLGTVPVPSIPGICVPWNIGSTTHPWFWHPQHFSSSDNKIGPVGKHLRVEKKQRVKFYLLSPTVRELLDDTIRTPAPRYSNRSACMILFLRLLMRFLNFWKVPGRWIFVEG